MSQRTILHVEDDADDAFFVARAFGRAASGWSLHRVEDGQAAIAYLERAAEPRGTDRLPAADLVLLDLKLPGLSGFDVLTWIRSRAQFRNLPVAILSGSSVEADKERARQLGANAYFVKTPDYAEVVAFVAEHWASTQSPLLARPEFGSDDLRGSILDSATSPQDLH